MSVTFGAHDVAISAVPLGVIGIGDSFEAALDDLVIELRLYARRFFARRLVDGVSDRTGLYEWLLRSSLTRAEEQLGLLKHDFATR